MARMHSRRRGASGSSKPLHAQAKWVNFSEKEAEKAISRLEGEGLSHSEIGAVLRDQYGIPSTRVVFGKKLGGILKKKDLPEDLQSLLNKMDSVTRHFKVNRSDVQAKRRRELVDAKIRRLVKYYSRKDRLPEGWKYVREKV